MKRIFLAALTLIALAGISQGEEHKEGSMTVWTRDAVVQGSEHKEGDVTVWTRTNGTNSPASTSEQFLGFQGINLGMEVESVNDVLGKISVPRPANFKGYTEIKHDDGSQAKIEDGKLFLFKKISPSEKKVMFSKMGFTTSNDWLLHSDKTSSWVSLGDFPEIFNIGFRGERETKYYSYDFLNLDFYKGKLQLIEVSSPLVSADHIDSEVKSWVSFACSAFTEKYGKPKMFKPIEALNIFDFKSDYSVKVAEWSLPAGFVTVEICQINSRFCSVLKMKTPIAKDEEKKDFENKKYKI